MRELDGGVEYGEPISRGTVEQVCRLLGYDPATVIRINLDSGDVGVITLTGGPLEPRTRTYHKHAVRP